MTDVRKREAANAKVWKQISEHVARGEEAEALLLEVWLAVGPYCQPAELPEDVKRRLRNFFYFDDSE
jgi:hypothetical protein